MAKFRPATADDISALHALIESAYRGDSARRGWTHEADLLGGQRTDPDALLEIVQDDEQIILLAMEDANLVGCVQLSRLNRQTGYLGMLTVNPEIQARGTGKQIIAAAEQYVQDHWGSSAMEMSVIGKREDLIAYYERRGYGRTGERKPFPMEDPRFGLPKTDELEFIILKKTL